MMCWLQEMCAMPQRVFRGQAKSCWGLSSTLDRCLRNRGWNGVQSEAWTFEDKLHNEFNVRVAPLLPTDVFGQWIRRTESEDSVVQWQVMQHYGCPTRLLDWTRCAYIAALCASIESEFREDEGAIWWYDTTKYKKFINPEHRACKWNDWNIPVRQYHDPIRGDRIFESVWRRQDVPDFFVNCFPTVPFQRMRLQRGLHTATSRIGLSLDEVLRKWFPDDQDAFGKVTIAPDVKESLPHLINDLRQITAGDIDLPAVTIEAGRLPAAVD